jgi:hypothetical protein
MAADSEAPVPDDREPIERTATPSVRDAMAAAAQRSALGRVTPGEAPSGRALLAAIGGIRGLIESILPGLMFLVVYTITQQLLPSVLAPLAVSIVLIVIRIASRQPVSTAIAGALGVGISAGLALLSGRAEDNFVPGFFINGAVVLLMLVSLAVRRPLVGVLVGVLTSDENWRRDRAKFRVATIATVLWATLSGLRLSVQLPLYALELPQALSATKLLMGIPLYAALLWVTWLLVRTAWKPAEAS